VSSHSRKKSPY